MSKKAIQQCITLAGTQGRLVHLMLPHLPERLRGSFRQGHISNWLNLKRVNPVPPAEYVLAMSLAVGGEVTPRDLRPDLYPATQGQDAA